jgi:hypothetical protein
MKAKEFTLFLLFTLIGTSGCERHAIETVESVIPEEIVGDNLLTNVPETGQTFTQYPPFNGTKWKLAGIFDTEANTLRVPEPGLMLLVRCHHAV